MGLRIFSVVGESLNFGGRRMETIVRVAWLPVLLSLVAGMAGVFAMLSIVAERLITFSDIPTFAGAQQQLGQFAARGFQNHPGAMWTIMLAGLAVQAILTASFMAPLIRYAGLGEKPTPGFMHAPFGPDQMRYVVSSLFSLLFVAVLVFGPMAAVSCYTRKYIVAAKSEDMASFPDPGSLHTIEITTAGDRAAAAGKSWLYNRAIPLSAAAPVALLFWAFLFFHFAPKNRPHAPATGSTILRLLTTFVVAAGLMLAAYFFLAELMVTQFRGNVTFLGFLSSMAGAANIDMSGILTGLDFTMKAPSTRVLFFGAASFFVMNYVSIRLFAYPGVAVCRKSLALGDTLAVTRGWNILRLFAIVTLVTAILTFVQVYVLNAFLFQFLLPQVVSVLYQATSVSTKLVNSGVTADWVRPVFVWSWNITKIIANMFWSFFSFGVTAGLYGRLYRESEKG